MQRIFFLLLLLPLLFSCNEEEPEFNLFGANGSFTLRGEEFPLSLGLASITPDGNAPDFVGLTLNGLLSSSGVQLSIRQTDGDNLPTGTFDFCNECSETGRLFDGGVIAAINETSLVGVLTGGSVTIESTGTNTYRIVFDLMYGMSDNMQASERVQGSFEGTVTLA